MKDAGDGPRHFLVGSLHGTASAQGQEHRFPLFREAAATTIACPAEQGSCSTSASFNGASSCGWGLPPFCHLITTVGTDPSVLSLYLYRVKIYQLK